MGCELCAQWPFADACQEALAVANQKLVALGEAPCLGWPVGKTMQSRSKAYKMG